jgi:hypothetical protein
MLRLWLMAIPGVGPALTAVSFVPAWAWKWLGIAAIAFCLFTAGDIRGTRIANEKCEAAAKRAQKAADAQDLQAEKEGRQQDLQVTNSLIEQKKVDDATIAKLKKSSCAYDKTNADPDSSVPQRRSLRHPLGGAK